MKENPLKKIFAIKTNITNLTSNRINKHRDGRRRRRLKKVNAFRHKSSIAKSCNSMIYPTKCYIK